jgi:phosphoglycerate dehydrogenase-like enzyme
MKPQSETLHIVTMHPFTPAKIEQVKAAATKARIDFAVCGSPEEFDRQSKDAEVIYGDIRGEALRSASKLKWVQAGGAGLKRWTRRCASTRHP